ncbi:hypothetical protein B0H17DRAFT_107448 [Mycena rosella]|uniref:F-box domain-containing protein n=1 Tax=Mycena rosella TaxID=1033263 RepID=A0AAD7G8N1_MYCRO|nr:hypothetical protein B0H17DRAFT_107448 [Mycena rosella]
MESCSLPLEVVDLIIGQLDLAALKACSVVSASLLPSCRSHLFQHLELRPTGKASPENWNQFLSASPHIIPYIRGLEILCQRSSWVSWDPVLPTLLSKLEHIEEIEFLGCDFPWLPAALSSAIYNLFRSPSLKRVSLRLCVLPSSCFDLFGPALDSIALSEITIEPDVVVCAPEKSRPARPRYLMVEGKTVSAVVDWLIPSSETNDLEDLQNLCVKYQGDDPEALHAVERLLQCASNLKTLDISLYPAGLQSTLTICSAPAICYNQRLREIHLSYFDMDISSPTNQLPWLGSLLSGMTVHHAVQKISIDARHRPCPRAPVVDHSGWANVDAILARLAPLLDVYIQIGEAYSSSIAQISSCMPMLSKNGILRVTT